MKLFKRMGASKALCNIELRITSITLNVFQPLILKLRWTRGPQTDTCDNFEVNQARNVYDLNQTFNRTSNFYREKDGSWQRKECKLSLIYSSLGKEEQTGEITIDMSPFVGKGESYHSFTLTN